MSESDTSLVVVFRTADGTRLSFVKSLLDGSGVPYVVQGEEALALFPLGPLAIGLSKNLMEATVHVPREWEQQAREALAPPDAVL